MRWRTCRCVIRYELEGTLFDISAKQIDFEVARASDISYAVKAALAACSIGENRRLGVYSLIENIRRNDALRFVSFVLNVCLFPRHVIKREYRPYDIKDETQFQICISLRLFPPLFPSSPCKREFEGGFNFSDTFADIKTALRDFTAAITRRVPFISLFRLINYVALTVDLIRACLFLFYWSDLLARRSKLIKNVICPLYCSVRD